MDTMRRILLVSGAPSLAAICSCSGASDGTESLGKIASAVTFPSQVTGYTTDSVPATSTYEQAETNLAFSQQSGTDVREIVTYNDFTAPADFAVGYSLMGWSYSSGSSWTHSKLTPSPTSAWPLYWGDPSIVVNPGNTNEIFITNIGVPLAKSNPLVQDGHSFGGTVVARSTDRGTSFAFYQGLQSFAAQVNGDFYDGSSLAAGSYQGNTVVVAAMRDSDTNSADIWKSSNGSAFSMMTAPFSGRTATTHPRVRVDSFNRIFIGDVFYSFGVRTFWANYTNGAGTWQGLNAGLSNVQTAATVTLSDRTMITGPEFSIAVGNETSTSTELRIAYTYVGESGHFHVGVNSFICNMNGTGCSNDWGGFDAGWSTEQSWDSADHWSPNIAYGNGGWRLTYFSRDDAPTGNTVSLYSVVVPASGQYNFNSRTLLAGPQVPCLDGNYWGDYNDLKYNASDNSFNATYPYSAPGCTTPIHVYQARIP
jgi:hypothetical protein